jgi:hypothetical protein
VTADEKPEKSAAEAPKPAPAPTPAANGDGGRQEQAGQAASSAAEENRVPRDTTVTVVPGITRYHRDDCILIRFLGEDDLETMTLARAEETDCAPCRACRPEVAHASA